MSDRYSGDIEDYLGYSIAMNMDDTVAVVTIRCENPMMDIDVIAALREIADQQERRMLEGWDGDH